MIKLTRRGFTLAEVLVTLLIIGVVASLTIPGLIANTNKTEYVVKLKKEQSILMQAFNLVALDAGGSITNDSNFTSVGDTGANAMNEFATKLNIVKNCGSDIGCWYTSPLKLLGGTNYYANVETALSGKTGKAILADGTSLSVVIWGTSCNSTYGSAGTPLFNSICGTIDLDVNGIVGPNVSGRDYFRFWITKTGIYPLGTFGDGHTCDINSTGTGSSDGCAGKVLTEGAMNY